MVKCIGFKQFGYMKPNSCTDTIVFIRESNLTVNNWELKLVAETALH